MMTNIQLIMIIGGIVIVTFIVCLLIQNIKKPDPIYNIAEIRIDSINSEEIAIDIVKSLAQYGYDTDAKNTIGWQIYGRKRYIINPETWQTPPTLTTPDLMKLFNDSVNTLRDLGSVVIQIDQGAGAIDIRIKKE